MEKKEAGKGSSGTGKSFRWVFPWVVVLIIQIQFFLLWRELSEAKLQILLLNHSGVERRMLFKRSAGESDAVKKVSGVDAVHLRPTFPFQKIEKDGRIGPWSSPPLENAFVTLKANDTEVEFTGKGIYHVYSQIYYLTNHSSNSYHVLTYNRTEERRRHRTVSTCACQGRNAMGEVSCYTGFTGIFNRGDRVYLHQIEQNRIIHSSSGGSFLGIVFLRKLRGDSKWKP